MQFVAQTLLLITLTTGLRLVIIRFRRSHTTPSVLNLLPLYAVFEAHQTVAIRHAARHSRIAKYVLKILYVLKAHEHAWLPNKYLSHSLSRHGRGDGVYGVTHKHMVLMNFEAIRAVLMCSRNVVDEAPTHNIVFIGLSGAFTSMDSQQLLQASRYALFQSIMREMLRPKAVLQNLLTAEIPSKVASFVCSTDKPEEMPMWQQSASTRFQPEINAVSADLDTLAKNFIAGISIPLFYGEGFAYHGVLDDIRALEDALPVLIMPLPTWFPLSILQNGLRARRRLLRQLESVLGRAEEDKITASALVRDRSDIYMKDGWSLSTRAECELAVLFGLNSNTSQALFWLLAFIYSDAELLEDLRTTLLSILGFAAYHNPSNNFTPAEIDALVNHCALLKATIYETFRMIVGTGSIRGVNKDCMLRYGENQFLQLRKGMFVSAHHSACYPDQFPDAEVFQPRRYLDDNGAFSHELLKGLRPWGIGPCECKAKTWAEQQLTVTTATIIMQWNITPESVVWRLPQVVRGVGVKRPVEPMRVYIKRRQLY